jgi:hypothetical protein
MTKRVHSRASVFLSLLAVVLVVLGVAFQTATPAAAKGEDATPLLNKAVETMGDVQSFRFELSTVQGQSIIMNNLELDGVVGAVQRPDRFEATITAKVAVVKVDVRVVGVGRRLWVTDPLASTETFIDVTDQASGDQMATETLSALVNPDRLLLTAVGLVDQPTVDGTESIDGVKTTRIVGTVDFRKLPQFQMATPEAASEFLVLEEMPITIWVDEAGHVVSMEIEGPLTVDESPDVVRRLDLFEFDEPVDIVEPVTGTPAAGGS